MQMTVLVDAIVHVDTDELVILGKDEAKNALKTYQDALDPCEPRIVVVCLPATVYGASSPRIRLDDTQEVTGSSPA